LTDQLKTDKFIPGGSAGAKQFEKQLDILIEERLSLKDSEMSLMKNIKNT